MSSNNLSSSLQAIQPSFWDGIGTGFLNILGLGDMHDTLGQLQSAASDAANNTQQIYNISLMQYAQGQNQLNQDLYSLVSNNNSKMTENIKYYNSITSGNLLKTNIFLEILSLIIFITIFFLLIK